MTDLAVIMAVYQNDKLNFVKGSVQSILDQTFTDFHYYLAFDGTVSQDVDDYIASLKDKRLRLFRLKENRGLANALNHLLKEILKSPEYIFIARMDADDISIPDRFKHQRDFLLKNNDISCVGSWYEEIDEYGRQVCLKQLPVEHKQLRERYMTRAPFAHSSVMYRRRLIELSGFYPTDTVLMEDNVLWGSALKHGIRFANLPSYLFKFRIDEGFYIRRSGIRYGWNYIQTRLRINKVLNLPLYCYFYTTIIGLLKMMPPFFLRYFY